MAARSTVNVMVVALLSVLVLVLIFLLVLQNQALEDTRQQHAKMEKEFKTAQQQKRKALEDAQAYRKVITGSATQIDVSDVKGYVLEAWKHLLRARSEQPPQAEQEVSFQDLLRDYQVTITKLGEQTSEHKKVAEKANSQLKQRETAHRTAIDAKMNEITKLETDNQKLRREVEDLEGQLADKNQKYTTELVAKDDEYAQLTFRYERDTNLLKETVAQRDSTITRLKMELIPLKDLAHVTPHGRIVRVGNRHSAYIDLGRANFVRPGIVFEVYEQIGKTRVKKGMVEINRVDATWSRVTILSEDNEFKPIVAGDLIWSPFYKKEKAPTLVVAGEKLNSPLLSVEFLKQRLAARGATVADKVDVNTDYLIAIEGYEDDPQYELARQFQVIVLREGDILGYVLVD